MQSLLPTPPTTSKDTDTKCIVLPESKKQLTALFFVTPTPTNANSSTNLTKIDSKTVCKLYYYLDSRISSKEWKDHSLKVSNHLFRQMG